VDFSGFVTGSLNPGKTPISLLELYNHDHLRYVTSHLGQLTLPFLWDVPATGWVKAGCPMAGKTVIPYDK